MAKAFLDVPSISGADDEQRIKGALMVLEGIQRVDVNVPATKVLLTYDDTSPALHSANEALAALGMTVTETTTAP
jgi:hypothetical protein